MQNDELGVLRRRYVRYLRLERGYSDNTIESYTHDIDYLLNYLRNENLKVEDVKLEHLQNFAAVIYEFGIASSSQARILCGVRSFFKLNPGIAPYEEAEKWMKKFALKTYSKKMQRSPIACDFING